MGLVIAAGEFRLMAILSQVEIEPIIAVKPGGRAVAARRMKSHQMTAAIAFAQAVGHHADNFLLLVAINRAIAAQNPNDSFVFISAAQPFAVQGRVRCVKQWFAFFDWVMPIAAPRGEKANEQSKFICFVDDEINMIPIVIVWPIFSLWPRRIEFG